MSSDPNSRAGASVSPRDGRRGSLRLLGQQFSKFSLVGVAGTIVHYGVMATLIEAFTVGPVVSTALGFLSSAVVSYWLNYRITFASRMEHRQALPRFLLVGTIGLVLNAALVAILTGPARLHWLPAQAIATLIVLCWNFGANRIWTFSMDLRSNG